MAKENIQVSFGIEGMERQNFQHLLSEKVFSFQKNGNIETDEESIALTNEHSNLLCSKFKPGYVIIGHKYDSINSRVWFFITEKDANENGKRKSEIGYISNNPNISDVEDAEADCGCDIISILSEPLENTTQIEYCTYQTLIGDDCNNCLNFDPNYPIHTVVLKQEACGFTMTFTSKNNPPRYIIVDKIADYKFKGSVNCGIDNTEPTCLDCDKLRVFPLYDKPHIFAESVSYGGRLRRGTYEFYVAYCDKLGNELSPYVAATNQVDIFDSDNIELDQTTQYNPTNLAIKLKVTGLDYKFNFYKVAVIEKANVSEVTSVFEEGIHSITDTNILYTSNGSENDKRLSLNKLFVEKAVYKNWGGIIETNGYLMAYDYEVEKEWNLQPVVNLMGMFAKWQTGEATENLYKDGVNISNFKSYMRDEVYPVGIRFISNTGYKTSLFPFIGRPPLNSDLTLLDKNSNKDIASILENAPLCDNTDRKHYWQFYNTAKVLGDSFNSNPGNNTNTKVITKQVEEDCIQEGVKSLQNGVISFDISEEFYSIQDWVDTHYDDICNPSSTYYNAQLCNLITDDITTQCDTTNIFPFPVCTSGCGAGTCDTPVKISSALYIGDIINEKQTLIPKRYPWEPDNGIPTYLHSSTSGNCLQFTQASSEVKYNLEVKEGEYFDIPLAQYIQRTDDAIDNTKCSSSAPIPMPGQFFKANHSGFVNLVQPGIFMTTRYYTIKDKYTSPQSISSPSFDPVQSTNNLLTTIKSTVYPGFNQYLHTEALWYEIDLSDITESLIEITPINGNNTDITTLTGDDVRFTIYDNCSNYTIMASGTYKSNEGLFKLIKKSEFSNKSKLYLALDTKIIQKGASKTYTFDDKTIMMLYQMMFTSTVPGCFDVKIRPKEYYKAEVTFDLLTVNKKTTYTSNCKFNVPANDDCGVVPHKYGYFSYWESSEDYPDNSDLYDSSVVKLKINSLAHEDLELRNMFRDYYVQTTNSQGEVIWREVSGKSRANFTCEPIRHFKFPDNGVIPFMSTIPLMDFSDSKIYPIGLTIDERTINAFLDAAVDSFLITKEQRDTIIGYEIYRGDRTISKSIIFKGIMNDMYEDPYQTTGKQRTFFRNFPYNTLGKNAFLTQGSDRNNLISHPYSSTKNDRFSLIAPEVYYSRPSVPTELSVDGYVYGSALSGFTDVDEHSEWVLLGNKAYDLAEKLANAEIVLEAALNIATLTVQSANTMWFMVGFANGSGVIGTAVALIAIGTYTAIQIINLVKFKKPKLKAQWLEIFEQRGSVNNFASMAVSPKGFYNYFKANTDKGDMMRGIVTGKYLNNGLDAVTEVEGNSSRITLINNKDRENSVYLFTGTEYPVNYPAQYSSYDNYDTSPKNASRYLSSEDGCENIVNSIRRIASPYATLKNYIPDQYGKIDEVKWLSTNHDSKFNSESKNIFGGDTFISRVDFKNKFKFFRKTAVRLANRTPYKYSKASNIGYARFYIDYKSADEEVGQIDDMPYLTSQYNLDCYKSSRKFYETPPSKFYLFSYGIPYFLVESEINCNFRYAGKEYHEQFASRGVNVEDWVQEVNVSIAQNNIFYYNSVYSRNQTGLPYRILPAYYDREKWDCLSEAENGVAWSQQDNSEVSLSDPWLVWKPFDIYRFKFSYGKLIGLNSIESTQVMGRFADNMTVFNAVDVLRDRVTPENEELGTGGIFATRPVQYSYTELGETGSQHRTMVSCEFGHFWVDAKRGKVFQLQPNAQGLNVVSDFKGKGDESGMRKWFKRHLPFKILKQNIDNLTDMDIDNTFKGIGILMWWDSRFKRVFITKRDYIVQKAFKNQITFSGGNYYLKGNPTPIELTNETYFKDISWTVAYSPIYQSWISYYDFHPDFAIAYNDYFQTGINYSADEKERGIWSHLLTNKSWQVFYGKYYPWEIEVPIKNTYTNNILQDLKIWTVSKRYHNEYDYAIWRKKSFNKINIYNQTNNSGLLHLNYDDSYRKSKYPISISKIEQGIQATHTDNHISLNYFYNRVKNEENHLPLWNWDENEINKYLNPDALSFILKRVPERMRGDWFMIRLIQDNTSQFKHYFKWMIFKEQSY